MDQLSMHVIKEHSKIDIAKYKKEQHNSWVRRHINEIDAANHEIARFKRDRAFIIEFMKRAKLERNITCNIRSKTRTSTIVFRDSNSDPNPLMSGIFEEIEDTEEDDDDDDTGDGEIIDGLSLFAWHINN